ncbi:MAG: glycoside hydrolase family 78 protein, partial [Nanoarchaeota archaeon]|nr:glycoside hydrolase family 78 protein [Nanoarchaeota archaeon]
GPIRLSRIYEGETYDARKEQDGWDEPGFDDSSWHPVKVASHLGKASLVPQYNEPIRITQELKPAAVTEPKPGVFVFDLGQNMVGWSRIRLRASAGAKVVLKHNERLNPDGTVYMENLRAGFKSKELRRQVNEYTCRGDGEEIFEPHFTYQGFRYVEVSGLSEPVDFCGRVFHSSAPVVGSFECSDPMLNKLWQNILWTQRGNLMSVPTDCPQRDERMGWTGDMQTFSQTAIFNMDMAAFFRKWTQDMRDDQLADGQYPDYIPFPGVSDRQGVARPGWADAGTIVPWRVYVNYADRRLLEDHFVSARRWVDYVQERSPDLIWHKDKENGGAEHLGLGAIISTPLFATAFFAHSTDIVAKMAAVLNRGDDAHRYRRLFEDIRTAFIANFVKEDGCLSNDVQGAYALALHFGLIPEEIRHRAAKRMVAALERDDGRMTTGIITTGLMMLELSRNGYHEQACKLALSRKMPSWGFMIDQGATTIWEHWNGWTPENGFQNPAMNSFNHYVFGSVGEWMMCCLAGLNHDENYPGWKRFIIRPRPDGGLTEVKAHYDSVYGRVASHWQWVGSAFTLNVSVPVNTVAVVYIPSEKPELIEEGGMPVAEAPGVKLLKVEDGCAVYEVCSGTYCFRVTSQTASEPRKAPRHASGQASARK